MVHVGDHGHDRRDGAVFGRARGDDAGEGAVAEEVARAADAVHQLRAHHVGGVDVAVDVHLDGGVDGDHPQAADHLGRVGDLHRPQHDLVAVAVEFVQEAGARLVRQGQGRARGGAHLAQVDEFEHRVLQHLGVDVDGLEPVVVDKAGEHRVGHVAHPGLPGQPGRQPPLFRLVADKVEDVGGDAPGGLVRLGEHGAAVLGLAQEDAHHPVRVHVDERLADAVAGPVDGDGHAVGRVLGDEDVVDAI